jgi:hypothetical protein
MAKSISTARLLLANAVNTAADPNVERSIQANTEKGRK